MDTNNETNTCPDLSRPAAHIEMAKILIHQIGRRALFMLGAKSLTAVNVERGQLTFRIGRNALGVNLVRITLTGADLYNIEFCAVRAGKCKIKSTVEGAYAEDLHDALETGTGMYVSL